jgi:hypothetical protein
MCQLLPTILPSFWMPGSELGEGVQNSTTLRKSFFCQEGQRDEIDQTIKMIV